MSETIIKQRKHAHSGLLGLPMYLLIATAFLLASVQVSAVIIDNDDLGTSSTGNWQLSSGADPYDSDSLWARDGATYTWTADSLTPGLYEVELWWTEFSSRSTAVPIQITGADGTFDTTVNQQTDGGQWNSVGQFYFDGTGSVQLSAPGAYPTSYSADAVQFTLIQAGQRPEATINSITPSPAGSGVPVSFAGIGNDDGTIVDSQWESDIDGVLGNGLNLNNIILSDGVHTISFTVQDNDGLWSAPAEQLLTVGTVPDEYIIDNGQSGTSSTGIWSPSGATGFYGTNSLWGRDGATYTWSFTPAVAGNYEVFMWWTEFTSRSSSVPVQINHAGDTTDTTVNQQVNGGQWKSLGTYVFDGSGSVVLSAPGAYPTSYSADAVRFLKVSDNYVTADFEAAPTSGNMPLMVAFTDLSTTSTTIQSWEWDFDNDGSVDSTAQNPSYNYTAAGTYTVSLTVTAASPAGSDTATKVDYITVIDPSSPPETIIDNRDAETSSVGTWSVSGGADPWGTDSVYNRLSGNSFSWLFTPPVTGYYQVSMWWTEFSSRSTVTPVSIQNADGTASTTVNQQTDGGQWNVLGEYRFEAGTEYPITISTLTDNSSISADAVRLVKIPDPAVIADFESNIQSGNLPLNVTFTDTSTGSGTPTAWAWDFDNNGTIDSTAQNPAHLYNAAGVYTVSLTVTTTGPAGSDTETKTDYITVSDPDAPETIIVDDGDPGTSSTGIWDPSGGDDPWDGDSLYARNTATYTWEFTPTLGGVYEVSLWWTEFSSRGTAVPVAVSHQIGTTNLTVNQQTNGGQWNILGQFPMAAGVTYQVTLSTPGGTPTASADAVKLVRIPVDNIPPVASIDEIDPNPGLLNQPISFTGSGVDVDGTIASYSWDSDIDGHLSSSPSFSTSSLSEGVHTISLVVTDDYGDPSSPVTIPVVVLDSSEIENVFACFCYGSERVNYQWEEMLVDIGAEQINDMWIYTNPAQDKSYVIRTIDNIPDMYEAMKTENSHMLIYGHSNYGSGPIFPTYDEQRNQIIEDLYYFDDERIFNYSSDTVAVSISGMINGQAYPNWNAIYQDGTSAVAPYNFGDPRGNPPYNYYVTYQIPGDPNYYRLDSPREDPIQRFPDSGRPAWYSPDGAEPDPSIASQRQYFITTGGSWEPSFTQTSGWTGSTMTAGFYGSNYLWANSGSGSIQGDWKFDVPFSGQYTISARWAASSGRTTAAPYTVTHEGGSNTVTENQQINGGMWNPLGTYDFKAGQDWYESRYDVPALVTLNQDNIAGNSTKKAKFQGSLDGNAYLSQRFTDPQTGTVRLEWDIYVDEILDDTIRDRGGMMMVGGDVGSGPNEGNGRFIYMAFWDKNGDGGGNGDPNDPISIVAREPGDNFNDTTQWNEIASGLEYDQWYTVAVECDTVAGTYDVYLNDVLVGDDISAYNALPALTYISFAQWNDGAGTFYVDNVSSNIPNLLVDGEFNDSTDSVDLRAQDTIHYHVTLTNDSPSGNVIADAVLISDVSNPPQILQANFYARTRAGSAPLDVTFYNESTGDDEQLVWNFGDGTDTVYTTNNNILHTFADPGVYTVTMTANSAGSSDTETKVAYITVTDGPLPQSAEFSGSYREGSLSRNVSFRDRSSGSVQSRLWDFGDGASSTSTNPSHTYTEPGNYTVSLTITFDDDSVQTVTKENYVRATAYEKIIDNVNYPAPHYHHKTILMRKELEIDPAELKYKRMFYLSCNSGIYYMQTLGRGIVFYSLDNTEVNPGTGFSIYLRAYMQGQSNQQILNALSVKQAAFDFYDFNKRPSQQQ